jgi:hypothetical protein
VFCSLQYAAFEDEVGIYLVTEYASRGDVFGELDRRGGSMTESDAVRQVRECTCDIWPFVYFCVHECRR